MKQVIVVETLRGYFFAKVNPNRHMFDFTADARNGGGSVGINNKGLVTYDRKTYKEALYIYQADWSEKPMVHVCGERFPDRGPEEYEAIVYSNYDTVTLYINGESVETLDVVDHAAVFHRVPLMDFLSQVGNLPAGGMPLHQQPAEFNSQGIINGSRTRLVCLGI